MSTPRDHHYVPQFYLRNFACDPQLNEIEVVTKHGDRAVWSQKAIKSIGYEFDLYVDPITGQSYEDQINHSIETPVSQSSTWQKIKANRGDLIDHTDKSVIYRLIRHFHSRTPFQEQTMRELAEMAASKKSEIEFNPEERAFYIFLHKNPSAMKQIITHRASSEWWSTSDIKKSLLMIFLSPIRLITSSTPVHTISAPNDPRIFSPLPGMVPHQLLLPLSPNILASLVLGNFNDGFEKTNISAEYAQFFNSNYIAQFAKFPVVRHLIIEKKNLARRLDWALYSLIQESSKSMTFQKKPNR